jgi:hypothetical protein
MNDPSGTVQLIIDNGTWSHATARYDHIHWGGGTRAGAESCAIWDESTDAQ